METNSMVIMVTFMVAIILVISITIETSIELNYRFLDLAGLE